MVGVTVEVGRLVIDLSLGEIDAENLGSIQLDFSKRLLACSIHEKT